MVHGDFTDGYGKSPHSPGPAVLEVTYRRDQRVQRSCFFTGGDPYGKSAGSRPVHRADGGWHHGRHRRGATAGRLGGGDRTHPCIPRVDGLVTGLGALVRLLAAMAAPSTAGAFAPGSTLISYVPGVLAGLWILAAGWLLVREHLPVVSVPTAPAVGPA